MKIKYKAIAMLASLASLGTSHAQTTEVWSGWTRITYLYPDITNFNFNTAYANTSLSSCDGGTRWVLLRSYPNYDALTAALMAAFIAGKQVNLNITVNPAQCSGIVNRFVVGE